MNPLLIVRRASMALTCVLVTACSSDIQTDGRQILASRFGGITSGLAAGKSVELRLSAFNVSESLTVSANGSFTFRHTFTAGSTFSWGGYENNVTVTRQPVGQTCTVGNPAYPGVPTADKGESYAVTCVFNPMRVYATSLGTNQLVGMGLAPATGQLTNLQDTPTATGAGPTSVAASPSGKSLYVVNRFTAPGTVWTYSIHPTSGALQWVGSVAAGSGPTHVAVDASERFVYVVNHSEDTVSGYTIDASSGALTPMAGSPFSTGTSTGPQSIALDPKGRFAYVTNEASGSLTVFTVNATTGALSTAGTVAAGSNPYGIGVHPSGKYVYVTNRSSDTVSAFRINDSTGLLTAIGNYSTGMSPLALTLEPSGRYLYVVNAESGTGSVSIFTINDATGTLSAQGTATASANPLFILADPSGQYVYVLNSGNNSVSSFRIEAGTGALTELAGSPLAITTAQTPVSLAISVKP